MLGCEAWLSSKVVICSVSSYLPSFVLPSKYMQMLVHAHSFAVRSYGHSCIFYAPLPQAAIIALRTCASRVRCAAGVAAMSIQVRNRQVSKQGLEAPSDPACRGDARSLGTPVLAREYMPRGLMLLWPRPRESRNPELAAQASCVSRCIDWTVLILLLQVQTIS